MSEFIDYEAELSEGEVVSDDELELSGDEQDDKELLADDEEEFDSDDEEQVRNLYHKQLDNDDRRQVLILKEQLEEKEIAMNARKKRFRWQMVDDMDRLGKHDDMDDFEADTGDDDDGQSDGDDDGKMFVARLRQPTNDYMFLEKDTNSNSQSSTNHFTSGPTTSAIAHPKLNPVPNQNSSDINKFLFRDKETVDALSATNNDHRLLRATREDKDRIVEREIKRVLQSKSIFDKLFD